MFFIHALMGAGLFVGAAWAGNPLISPSGAMIQWSTHIVKYHLSPGGLGPYTEAEIHALVHGAFRAWDEVPHSALRIEAGPLLPETVTVDNALQHINNPEMNRNPILLDSDGEITDLIYGQGASDTILGIATHSTERNGVIQQASVIINGRILIGSLGELNELWSTLLHEFGHFLGLGHSQLFPELVFDGDPSTNLHLPVMFPLSANDGLSTQRLSLDDQVTLAYMYPQPTLLEERGSITGAIFRPWGDPVQGANVIAFNVDQPWEKAVSAVSDRMIEFTGDFVLPGLPEGWYYIKIEPVHPTFYGASSVGPFAEKPTSPSFIDPVPPEYYNAERESGIIGEDDPEDREPVFVRAGEIVEGIEIITNEEYPSSIFDWSLYLD